MIPRLREEVRLGNFRKTLRPALRRAGRGRLAIVSAGYAFGQVSEKLMSDASSGVAFALLVVFLGLSWFLSRKLERVVERN